MPLTLLFLGPLEDIAGTAEMRLEVAQPLGLAAIAERLAPELAAAITARKVRLALNGNLVQPVEVLAGDGDELAFLPPVSGG